ncbi:MAG: 2-C-methyl-D-erythritol 4-phosphate cytidylyltransferase [Gammaproteobacteria bacterium]
MKVPTAPRIWAVIPAAGKGARMRSAVPKQYLPLLGCTVLEHTLDRFITHPRINGVIVAISADDERWPELARSRPSVRVALGGKERCHSVLNAMTALNAECAQHDWVLVHDAARPCVRSADIDLMIERLAHSSCGGILAVPVRDTLKKCTADGAIEATVERTRLWHALTPQMFRYHLLREALERAIDTGQPVTDEAQAIELLGGTPCVIEGHADNLKITRPEDLAIAELFLNAQRQATQCA